MTLAHPFAHSFELPVVLEMCLSGTLRVTKLAQLIVEVRIQTLSPYFHRLMNAYAVGWEVHDSLSRWWGDSGNHGSWYP